MHRESALKNEGNTIIYNKEQAEGMTECDQANLCDIKRKEAVSSSKYMEGFTL